MRESPEVEVRQTAAPAALESPLDLGGSDPEVTLAEGKTVLHGGGEFLALDEGRVFFTSKPSPRVCFQASGPSLEETVARKVLGDWQPERVEIPGAGLEGCLYEHTSISGDLRGSPAVLTARGEARNIASSAHPSLSGVTFHLMNFGEYHGQLILRGTARARDRLVLEAAGWRVTIDARENFGDLRRALRGEGGYAFTHVGELTRTDGTAFATEEAADVLRGLHWFLSFVRGAWVRPMLFVGTTAQGEPVWRDWVAGRTSRWSGSPSWCDPTNWRAAQQAYAGFASEWGDQFGQAVMRIAIGQYVSANSPNPLEVSIMVAQAGLELIGWAEFVETGQVAADDWRDPRRTRAADKIGKLLDLCNVDHRIPDSLQALSGLDENWTTGPEVVAGVRNALIHPRNPPCL